MCVFACQRAVINDLQPWSLQLPSSPLVSHTSSRVVIMDAGRRLQRLLDANRPLHLPHAKHTRALADRRGYMSVAPRWASAQCVLLPELQATTQICKLEPFYFPLGSCSIEFCPHLARTHLFACVILNYLKMLPIEWVVVLICWGIFSSAAFFSAANTTNKTYHSMLTRVSITAQWQNVILGRRGGYCCWH